MDRRQMHIHIFPCDRAPRPAARHEQNVCVLPVAADVSADDAMGAPAVAQNRGAGAVTKKDTRIAIGPVCDRRQFLCSDHKHRFVCM